MTVVHVLVMTMLIMLSTSFVRSFSIGTMRRRVWSLKQLQGNPNVDLFGADSVSLKLDGIDKNLTSQATEAAMTEYMKEAKEKASTSIVSSITGNRTMKAEALRLEAELDQIKFNKAKLNEKMERLAQIDRCIQDLIEERMSLNKLFKDPEYKFDDQFVLRIAELATMARTKEEQELFRGYMEEILKSDECSEVTKRVLSKVTKGAGNNS